jgi:hypothetical protein
LGVAAEPAVDDRRGIVDQRFIAQSHHQRALPSISRHRSQLDRRGGPSAQALAR